ncbi:MAG: hypothetical protein D3916_07725 [Candidatus Electrothrix sp. MAN1_4]|nr:hypothetical protein [Candidatus Electrothrix sp. MAN1_4]
MGYNKKGKGMWARLRKRLLPAMLRNEFGMSKELVVNGMLDHSEIWDKRAWQNEECRTRKDFSTFLEERSSLGIL